MHKLNQLPIVSLLARTAAVMFLFFFLLSCGKRDDRDEIRAQNGEPDEIQTIGKDPFWRELWYYNDQGFGYEFRRTSGCGTIQDTYVYYTFNFTPIPDSTSAPVSRPSPSTPSRSGSTLLSPQ